MEYALAQVGVAVLAISGVLSAARQRLDIFSVVVGLLTAIGGGTLRDVILDVPVFWLVDLTAFWVALGASFVAGNSLSPGAIGGHGADFWHSSRGHPLAVVSAPASHPQGRSPPL